MSAETSVHLNTQTLIGYTDKRGNAWHYRAEDQGAESNHYPRAIPVEDVRRRLFHWEPVRADFQAVAIDENGVTTYTDPSRVVIVRPDTRAVLGVFKQGYRVHGYDEWLIRNVETLVGGEVAIGSAGLLKGGAVAWVQAEMEDTLTVAGYGFRPFLTATTSLDGSLSTTYLTGVQAVVCDNTLSASLRDRSLLAKVKHSVNSLANVDKIREAILGPDLARKVLADLADSFRAEVETLTAQHVSEQRFEAWVKAYTAPTLGADGKPSKRSATMAAGKSDKLIQLWRDDDMVAPWRGTAFGVLQAANTYEHHFAIVRGASRADRNAERVVFGKVAEMDAHALQVLAAV